MADLIASDLTKLRISLLRIHELLWVIMTGYLFAAWLNEDSIVIDVALDTDLKATGLDIPHRSLTDLLPLTLFSLLAPKSAVILRKFLPRSLRVALNPEIIDVRPDVVESGHGH
ncbi:MAG: hypothetical protein J2P36_23505 [Ktedonobacteraceae bacterium]|nr:hypothetical protein [Ktedonobacteraceae bacterium]